MGKSFEAKITPQYESASELTGRESYDLAKSAVENLSTEKKESENFPGAEAYKKVMKIVVIAGANNEVIDQWQKNYEALEEEWKSVEEPELFVAELKANLQETLDNLAEAIEAEDEESLETAK